jgi:hypothetical protein
MKRTIIAFSTAALIAAAPAALAQGVTSKAPGLQHKAPRLQHKVSKKHHPRVSGYAALREMQAKGSKRGDPGASSYAPDERSRFLDSVRQGGGGGGGGSGMGALAPHEQAVSVVRANLVGALPRALAPRHDDAALMTLQRLLRLT